MNLSLAIAIMDENLKGPTATFDEMGLSAVRWAWLECRAALSSGSPSPKSEGESLSASPETRDEPNPSSLGGET